MLDDFGREALRAARWRPRFFADGFPTRLVRYAARSAAVRRVLADLVLGEQGLPQPRVEAPSGCSALPLRHGSGARGTELTGPMGWIRI
ncbi:MAG: hypothetical protein U0599_10490 [Vicinamibacteria bacterium]